jgi:hypothetical protein
MSKTKFAIVVFVLLAAIASCKKCNSIDIDPGPPVEAAIELSTAMILDAIAYNAIYPCEFSDNFKADIEIEVFTGTYDEATNTILPNTDPFFEMVWEDESFEGGNLVKQGTVRDYNIKVPETGACLIMMSIKTDQCSNCCKDRNFALQQNSSPENDPNCDGDLITNKCSQGKPTLNWAEIILPTAPRPIGRISPKRTFLTPGNCRGCNSCPDIPCI